MIRLLLAEDSPVQRELLSYVIRKSGAFEIVGSVPDGEEVVREAGRLTPDVVLMDCQMPKLDGIQATRAIMESTPTPIVVMTGSLLGEAVRVTFEAMENGALAVVAKPTAVGSAQHDRTVQELLNTVRLMSAVKVVRRRPQPSNGHVAPVEAVPHRPTRSRLIAIAGSTGAPSILADLLEAARAKVELPILVVQHMAEGFIEGFAGWLQQKSGLKVFVAMAGMQTEPGCVYIAPHGAHMGVEKTGRIMLIGEPPEGGFRPSATRLFSSVADAYGASGVGILLSGMGRDGAAGLLEMRKAGALTVAQDEESCVVFGMPQEAIRLGAVLHVLEPARIADLIVSCNQLAL